VKFTDKEGSVTISVRYELLNAQNAKLVFDIKDSGIGIKKNQLEHLFTMFTQVDESTTRSYEGIGMGLAVAKKIVDTLKGDLTVSSEFGKGSQFSFSVPVALSKEKKRNDSVNDSSGLPSNEVEVSLEKELNVEKVIGVISKLETRISNYDSDASESSDELCELTQGSAYNDVTQEIHAHLTIFEFDEALDKLKSLADKIN
jgi:hypothetical protein